jgi:aspartate kinase
MLVMKFGGTSVGDASAIKRLIAIVESRLTQTPIVVVSAVSQATNILQEVARLASAGDLDTALAQLKKLEQRHLDITEQLITDSSLLRPTLKIIGDYFAQLRDLLKGVHLIAELSDRAQAKIITYGELLSTKIVAAVFTQNKIANVWLDAREFIYTNNHYLQGIPDIELIEKNTPKIINNYLANKSVVLTQGFIANTKDKITTTLGREGSDCTATLIGMALNADEVEIWTDVDGMLTCDPNKISNPKLINKISFTEAAELAYFGAKVLHPATLQPAISKNIPVRVLNSKNPSNSGTLIVPDSSNNLDAVKSIAYKENVRLLNLAPLDIFMPYGFLRKIFDIFDQYQTKLDIVTISENKLCVLLNNENKLPKIINSLQEIANINCENNKALICLVGKNLKNIKGVAQRIFNALGAINVDLIAQGASANNLSLVINNENLLPALQSLHKEFFERAK